MILRIELDLDLQLGAVMFEYTLGGLSARRTTSWGSGIDVILRADLNLALQLGAVLFVACAVVFAEWTALTSTSIRIMNTIGHLPRPHMYGMVLSSQGITAVSVWLVCVGGYRYGLLQGYADEWDKE